MMGLRVGWAMECSYYVREVLPGLARGRCQEIQGEFRVVESISGGGLDSRLRGNDGWAAGMTGRRRE